MPRIFAFAVLFLVANVAHADPLLSKAQIAKASAEIEACLQKSKKPQDCVGVIASRCDDRIAAGGEAAHATCADNETAAWDVLLNTTWTKLSASMSAPRFAALKDIQKRWLDYRKVKCSFLLDASKNAGWGLMLKSTCVLDETSRRTIELVHIYTDPNISDE